MHIKIQPRRPPQPQLTFLNPQQLPRPATRGRSIFARKYNALGEAQGPEFRVNAGNSPDSIDLAVAMNAKGEFAIAWPDAFDGLGNLFAQGYEAAARAVGGVLQVNTTVGLRAR